MASFFYTDIEVKEQNLKDCDSRNTFSDILCIYLRAHAVFKACRKNIIPSFPSKHCQRIMQSWSHGGSPLTVAANVIAEQGLMDETVMLGGMNLPLALSAVLMKDSMETKELVAMLLEEAREELKQFQITSAETEDEI